MKQEYQSPTYLTTDFVILQTRDMTVVHTDTNPIRTYSTGSILFWQNPFVLCNLVEVFLLKMVVLSIWFYAYVIFNPPLIEIS